MCTIMGRCWLCSQLYMSKYGLTVGGHGVMDGIHYWLIYIYIVGLYKWVSLFMYDCMNYTTIKLVFDGC